MGILPIRIAGDPVLREKAKRVRTIDASIQKLIDDMIDTMAEYHGVGLAAPQVHEGLRLFVAALDAGDDEDESEVIAVDVAKELEQINDLVRIISGLIRTAREKADPLPVASTKFKPEKGVVQ